MYFGKILLLISPCDKNLSSPLVIVCVWGGNVDRQDVLCYGCSVEIMYLARTVVKEKRAGGGTGVGGRG